MQKLKLCMPRKGSQVLKPRQVLGERTSEVNNRDSECSDKENKRHNRSISSAR